MNATTGTSVFMTAVLYNRVLGFLTNAIGFVFAQTTCIQS